MWKWVCLLRGGVGVAFGRFGVKVVKEIARVGPCGCVCANGNMRVVDRICEALRRVSSVKVWPVCPQHVL